MNATPNVSDRYELGGFRGKEFSWEVSWRDPNALPFSCSGFPRSSEALKYAETLPPGCNTIEVTMVTRERFGVRMPTHTGELDA